MDASRTLDLADAEVNQDPDRFAREVLERGSVQWSDAHRAWLVFSHAEVADCFRDTRLSADRIEPFQRVAAEHPDAFGQIVELLAGWMIFRDPPAHTRLRDPVRRAVTPRVVEGVRPAAERIVEELLAAMPSSGLFDFGAGFAEVLPALVIADLLGVPGSERHNFKQWSDDLGEIVFSVRPGAIPADRVRQAADDFTAFFSELIEHRTKHPGDDLISLMVKGGANQLSAMEMVGACTLLLFAGHETTTNMLVSSVRVLHDHPDQRDRLVNDPAVLPYAADELLRVAGPAKSMVRRVAEPHERGGRQLERNQKVYLVILTANRDPAQFTEPERVDLGREPNTHLGFGWGLHHCLGAPLARMELTAALRRLYQEYPNLRPAEPDRPWSGNELGRGFGRMPVLL